MAKLRYSSAARRDIEEIEQYSHTEFGSAAAENYLNDLSELFDRIFEFPAIGMQWRDLPDGTRTFPYRSHRIFYRKEGGDILIQRVLHNRRAFRREMLDDR